MRKDNVVVQNNHHLLHYHHQLFIIMLIVIIIVIMQRVRGADSGKYLTGETTLTVTHSRQLHHHHHHCSHRHHRSHHCHHPYRHHHHVFHHQRRCEKSRKRAPTCIKFFMPVLSTRLRLLTGASSLRDFSTKPAKFRQFRLLVLELQWTTMI